VCLPVVPAYNTDVVPQQVQHFDRHALTSLITLWHVCIADGSAYLATPVNPVFVLLALLNIAPDQVSHSCKASNAGSAELWECLLHVSTFATTRVALPTEIEPRLIT
jgi:hypothetical protein